MHGRNGQNAGMKMFLLLPLCSLLGLVAGGSASAAQKFNAPAGLQLYSLRDQFAKDVPGTLDKVRDLGIKYVELAGTYGLSNEKFLAELKARGLVAVSGHFSYERYRDDAEGVANEAKALGLKFAGCAWIPHEGDFNEKACRAAAAVFNKAGAVLAKQGIKFFYHTHGYEFQPHGSGTLFDLLMTETDAKNVGFQMDVFWIVHPGQDPAKLLEKYSGRWVSLHVKDMRKGTPTGLLTGHTEVTNDVALGTGQIDYVPILRAAKRAKVKWYFLEDESPTVEAQLPVSLNYLKTVRF